MAATETSKPFVVGVDLGATKILASVFDAKHRIVGQKKRNTRAEEGAKIVIERVAGCIQEALAFARISLSQVHSIGIGIPGTVDARRGFVHQAPNLKWKNIPFSKEFRRHLKAKVTLMNDVQAGTLAVQKIGAGRPFQSFGCIFIGTGIGGGLVLDNKLYRGAGGLAGEIGHTIVMAKDGPKCSCGNHGCLESLASRRTIAQRIASAAAKGRKTILQYGFSNDFSQVRSRDLAEAYRSGDKLVVEIINDACEAIGVGAANLINLLNVEAVILGGGMIEALGDKMLPRIAKSARAHALKANAQNVHIIDTGLGDMAGVLGAGLAAREGCLTSPFAYSRSPRPTG